MKKSNYLYRWEIVLRSVESYSGKERKKQAFTIFGELSHFMNIFEYSLIFTRERERLV